ncbi:putative XRE-type DNA-binding protein [Nitrobacteraceae bacterium AZCC 1564]
MTTPKTSKITRSSGNIFADLGLENAQAHQAKAQLVMLISTMIEKLDLTQGQAATRMGLKQPDVSKLLRGKFEGFSLERLLYFVRALGSDVEIKIKPSKLKHEGKLLVTA